MQSSLLGWRPLIIRFSSFVKPKICVTIMFTYWSLSGHLEPHGKISFLKYVIVSLLIMLQRHLFSCRKIKHSYRSRQLLNSLWTTFFYEALLLMGKSIPHSSLSQPWYLPYPFLSSSWKWWHFSLASPLHRWGGEGWKHNWGAAQKKAP